MGVVVLTDSTACLPVELARRSGVEVVPLHVGVGRRTYAEGVDITAGEVAELLRSGSDKVTTSRPAPGELVDRYRALARAGATRIVSAHLSGQISGTVDAAHLAATAVSEEITVDVVDTRVLGMALGYAAISGAEVAAAAEPGVGDETVAAAVVEAIRARAEGTSTVMYLDSLEFLRRGGRVGTAQAILGQALAIKPLLTLADGQIELLEKVRTRGRALARVTERTIEAARAALDQGREVQIAVHHLAWEDIADQARDGIREGLSEDRDVSQVEVVLVELGAVTAVHAGPSTLAVVVAPR